MPHKKKAQDEDRLGLLNLAGAADEIEEETKNLSQQ